MQNNRPVRVPFGQIVIELGFGLLSMISKNACVNGWLSVGATKIFEICAVGELCREVTRCAVLARSSQVRGI
jgi:hypothetical protein